MSPTKPQEFRCGSDFKVSASPVGARRVPVIVVPVFGGWPSVETCIETLMGTIPADVPVRVVDDASEDPRLVAWLDTLEERFPERLALVRNPNNKGYLRSINDALASLDGDVVVANSDTRFTPGWLEALSVVAGDPAVGIANPISNNATVLSVPELDQASDAALAELRETFRARWYEVPTAVGYCMYIKQETLERYGGFDLLFDPGYGEECDYSMHLRRDGLKIAAVPASVVFHEGSCSFGERSASLRKTHDELLSLRWPAYHQEVLAFSHDNPVRGIREFLKGRASNAETRVLHVLHELDYLGGIELFTKDLLSRFSPQSAHVVLCPGRVDDPWADVLETRLEPNVRVIRFDPRRYPHPNVVMAIPAGRSHPNLDRLFCRIVAGGRFNCVHFHTLVRLGTLSWPSICTELAIPYVLSMHEFFHLCHDYNMVLGPGGDRSCGKTVSHEEDADCLGCMGSRVGRLGEPLPRFIEKRRRTWSDILHGAERIFTNGPLVSRSVTEAYGASLRASIREFEPYFYCRRNAIASVDASTEKPLHVAFLGAFSPRKGGEVFLAAHRLLAGKAIRWSVIGNVNSRLRPALANVAVEATGPYDTSQLDDLLADVDLVVQASIWPETYSITTSEAWERLRPVIAPKIGAFEYRISHGDNGWLYPPGDARALADQIERLAERRGREALGEVSQRLRRAGRRDNPIARQLERLYSRFPRRCLLAALEEGGQGENGLTVPSGAWSATRKWLDQPMCLEAEDDWEDPGELFCLVAEVAGEYASELTASMDEHASSARVVTNSQLAALPGDASVLVLQDDTVLTANTGNWIAAWRQSQKPFGTCNYLLHDGFGEPYSSVFRGAGDATFLFRNPRRWVGLIGNAARIRALLQRVPEQGVFDARLDRLFQRGELAHYDGCALSMLDRRWSALWKADLADAEDPRESDISEPAHEVKAGIVVQGGTGPGMRRLLADLLAQTGVNIPGVAVLLPTAGELPADRRLPETVRTCDWDALDPVESINRAVRALPPVEVIVFVSDNVRLESPRLLQSMIRDMMRYRLSAISPFVPSDRRGARFVTRRAGCGTRGLPGYGPPVSTSFDLPGVPLPTDFLDDDLFIVQRDAWRDVGGMPPRGRLFYRAVMLSEQLRSAGHSLARSAKFVSKAALPSTALTADAGRHSQEREEVLQALARSRAPSVWSKSISMEPPYGLEYRKHAFKGGGRSPRLLAYAHDRKHAFKGGGRSPRLLAYAHDVWASGFYRVRAPAAALAACNKASCHFLPEQRERSVPNIAEIVQSGASVFLLHSFLHDGQLEKLADYHRFLDIPIVFSLDDWLLELPRYNPFLKTNYPDMAKRVRYALGHCDRLIVPTRKLAEYYAGLISDIRVVPNHIPRALIRSPRETRRGKLRVAWAGAPQHAGDLDWLAPVVRQTRGHYHWVFFGQKPAGLSARECEFHPAVPLKGYFEKLSRLDLDVAVAPLSDNPFNRAKSNLKLLEYASLGLPVVCTDCEAYRDAPVVKLENDSGVWIDELIRLAQQPEERADLAGGLRNWLEQEHVLEDHLDDWGRALSLQP